MKALLPLTLLSLGLAGCGASAISSADKAGGSSTVTTLRLAFVNWTANGEDAQLVNQFANAAQKRSDGRIVIHVVDTAYGTPDEETRVVRAVRLDRFDLGWVTAATWETSGVESFAALQAPFLIDRYRLMDAVATSPLADRLLARLERRDVIGLALVPDALLRPNGPRPLLQPADYRGLDFLVLRSRTTDALLRVLGATPRFTVRSVTKGPPGALEPTWGGGADVLTANVSLAPRLDTLFANASVFRRLSDADRETLRSAARDVVRASIRRRPSEQAALDLQCQSGTIAFARPDDLRSLRRATANLTRRLERDPETRATIAAIRRLGARTPADPRVTVPRSCAHAPPLRFPNTTVGLDGTYRYTLTRAGALAYQPTVDPGTTYPLVVTATLAQGHWTLRGDTMTRGSYTVSGREITFRTPGAEPDRFTFKRESDGDLLLRPVLPMDRGDRFVMSSAMWTRIGAPP